MNENNLDVYVTFVATCSAVFIGLLAFVYPQIFATIERINLISSNLKTKLDKELYIKIFLPAISSFLVISILSLLILSNAIYNFGELKDYFHIVASIINYLNLFLVILSVFVSYNAYAILKRYEVEPYKLFSVNEIADFLDKKVKEPELYSDTEYDDCTTIMQIVRNDLIKNDSIEKLGKYLNLYKDIFSLTICTYNRHYKDAKEIIYPDFIRKTLPYFEPLVNLQYLNQCASDAGCKNISNNIIEITLNILSESKTEIERNDPFRILFDVREKIITSILGMFLYKISHKTYNKDVDAFQVFDFYKKLASEQDYKNAKKIINTISIEIIRLNYDFDCILNLLNLFIINTTDKCIRLDDVQIIVCNIISFLIYRSDFLSAASCFYFQRKQGDHNIFTSPIIPDNINSVLLCFFGENNVFDLGDFPTGAINKENSLKYKFYVFVICLSNYLILKENDRCNMYENLEDILQFEDKIVENINKTDPVLWKKFLDQLFENQELVSIFHLKEKETLQAFMYRVFSHVIICKSMTENKDKII